MPESNRRITFAYHLDGWNYEDGNKNTLRTDGTRVIPSEYQATMDGKLFCPGCYTNLNRVPKDKEHFTNGREPYFAHLAKYSQVACDLRSKRAEGKRYDTYEEASRAIDREELVIVSSFVQVRPQTAANENAEYDETAVEDIEGPVSEVPIARHTGQTFSLPSRIKTVAGLCRNFDQNLYRYFFFPNQAHAVRLIDLLHNVENVTEEDETPKLYYGRIISTTHFGDNPQPHNIRMTYLAKNQGVVDFCLKTTDQEQRAHGITDQSIGRYILVFGRVSENGIGLCFENLGWGELSLLPEQYNSLLP